MAVAPNILICDDDPVVHESLGLYLDNDNFTHSDAYDGRESLEMAQATKPDLILLDVMMPEMSGLDVCRELRKTMATPIIMLTAKGEEIDKIVGLELGADDYIVKPFSIDELGARVSAHLRRENRNKSKSQVLFDFDFIIDYSQRAVFYKGNEIPLTKKEFDILEVLSQNPGQVFDKERLYEAAWGLDGLGNNSVIAEHISQIRAKLAAVGARQYIETVWGVGYKWAK